MCISPSFIWVQRGPNWEHVPTPCKACWRCKSNRLNDYVGRCMAEASTSDICATVSLTYAPRDDLADKVLTPRHFQLFMKLLRRAGHKVRYLVAGEYGDLKSRAHFHAILFFEYLAPSDDGQVPGYNPGHVHLDAAGLANAPRFCREIPQMDMVHIREWPHGHIKCDWRASEKSARYVCKYLLSDNKNNAWFSLSKKPPIGAVFFAQKAEKAKALGVLPSTFEYTPPGAGRKKTFLMTGATRRDFLNAISTDEARRPRMSEWVQKTFDKLARDRFRAACAAPSAEELIASFRDRLEISERETDKVLKAQFWNDLVTADLHKELGLPNGIWVKVGKDWSYVYETQKSEYAAALAAHIAASAS